MTVGPIVGVTGHRSLEPFTGREVYSATLGCLRRLEPSRVILGLAIGFDTAVAIACVELQIPFVAAIPFDEQARFWQPNQKRAYEVLLGKAERVWKPTGVVGNACYFVRNNYIVDNSDLLLGFVVRKEGGSAYTWDYAAKKQKRRVNVLDDLTALSNRNVLQQK